MSDTAQWEDVEVGVYFRLLCTQWVNKFLIDDVERLRKLTTQSPDAFNKIWTFIRPKFIRGADGNLRNEFLEVVRRQQENFHKEKSQSGQKGAAIRWGNVVLPWLTDDFKAIWEIWKQYKKDSFNFTYRTEISEQASLKKLARLSDGVEAQAVKIIHQSIEEQWQGFFPIKSNYGKTNSTITTSGIITSLSSRYKRS